MCMATYTLTRFAIFQYIAITCPKRKNSIPPPEVAVLRCHSEKGNLRGSESIFLAKQASIFMLRPKSGLVLSSIDILCAADLRLLRADEALFLVKFRRFLLIALAHLCEMQNTDLLRTRMCSLNQFRNQTVCLMPRIVRPQRGS